MSKVLYKLLIGGVLASSFVASASWAADTIKIGEVNSYKAMSAFLGPYKKGWEMGLDEINSQGGVLGKNLEVIYRDDNANPGDAIRVAEELRTREKVSMIFGGFLSHTGLALTDYAKRRKMIYLAAEPLTDKIVWENGNDYTFRLRPSTYMQVAMLIPDAVKLNKKRWGLVYPNYEYGQSAVATFMQLLSKAQPGVEFVVEQATPLGKIDAGSVVQALDDAKPDAIFNVLFGADLGKFVREGNTRGLFAGKEVFSLLTGEPEYLDPMGAEAPEGWYVTGYPWNKIDTPEHNAFKTAYEAKYGEYPRAGSIVGYTSIKTIAALIKKAGSTDTDDLIKAFSGLSHNTPFGPITYRSQDNQSTFGAFVGQTALVDGKGEMVNFRYVDGADVQPSDEEVAAMRPAN
ncbi:ABC transporter substrate-binding protein [Marinomonas ushuaiensis DSM 15871]|uniref:ABC transporter substrate-binding protein n=1 Tax=Marinomonas ushuaiensis DSM 15871 TaxID=1122207 RepID=X7E7Q7_9GAMM|nr:ABC transporter substrate-binding protein [Marinomonas ushuaiensis]ETX12109.1 ABC transporter substrate-binding protein [Marinomonas ushuaiensis DSM 15871]